MNAIEMWKLIQEGWKNKNKQISYLALLGLLTTIALWATHATVVMIYVVGYVTISACALVAIDVTSYVRGKLRDRRGLEKYR
jgi:hypothetical protein